MLQFFPFVRREREREGNGEVFDEARGRDKILSGLGEEGR